jgi:uncharacterized membrane-anchored protein
MHICKEDIAFRELKVTTDRKLEREFRRWLLDCHVTYDQEVQFIGEKFIATENKTLCDGIKKSGETIKKGDFVCLRTNKTFYARVDQVIKLISRCEFILWCSFITEERQNQDYLNVMECSRRIHTKNCQHKNIQLLESSP